MNHSHYFVQDEQLGQDLPPELAKLWQRHRTIILGRRFQSFQEALALYQETVGPNRDQTLLDVACGMGEYILELGYLGYACHGIDMNEDKCAIIDHIAQSERLPVQIQKGSGDALPFDDAVFDVVMSKSYFEHVPDPDLALREQIRVLKPGGKLLIIDGNFLYPPSLFGLLVLYPIRTKGKYGGLKWLFTKHQVRQDIYQLGWDGKDEDYLTLWQWQRFLACYGEILEPLRVTTHKTYLNFERNKRNPTMAGLLRPFYGWNVSVCLKK